MYQPTFGDLEHDQKRKRTRREVFLDEMEQVVPWKRLLALIMKDWPKGKNGRPPYPAETMLRIHFLQQWFAYGDLAMEEALYESMILRRFARVSMNTLPDETTILNFRHRLEEKNLAKDLFDAVNAELESKGLLLRTGTVVDATIIHAPSSTKNSTGQRDPEMHQTRKGNQWYHGMKAHIGADDQSGLVHTLVTTAANASDVSQTHGLLHGEEARVYGDAGYTGAHKREECSDIKVDWRIAARRSTIQSLEESPYKEALLHYEYLLASVRAKVEHPFRIVKRQFGYVKVRYRGLAKNTGQLYTLFALSNLWMVRRKLLAVG